MRIAVISDVHGNLVALEAVLADLAAQHAERIVCLGDVALSGPQPREAIARLKALNCPVIMGNCDTWMLAARSGAAADEHTDEMAAIDRWCAAALTSDDLDYLRTFQPTFDLSCGDGATLFCYHGSPRSNTEEILPTTPDEELAPMFAGISATVMAGGHTHEQMLRRYRDAIVVNPGSVGLPVEYGRPDGSQPRTPPWAEYALVDGAHASLSVTLRRVPVDVAAVVRAALASGMPHAEWWARDWRA